MDLSDDGRRLVTGGYGLQVWDLPSGRLRAGWSVANPTAILSVALLPSGVVLIRNGTEPGMGVGGKVSPVIPR